MARNILIIDDEASIRQSLSGALKDENFQVMSAGSGEEGLGIVRNSASMSSVSARRKMAAWLAKR